MVEIADKIKSFRQSVERKKTERKADARAKARKRAQQKERINDLQQKARNDLRRASAPVTDRVVDAEDEARRSKQELSKLRQEVVPTGRVQQRSQQAAAARQRVNEFIDEFDDYANERGDLGKAVEEPFLFDQIDTAEEDLFTTASEGDVPDPLDFEPVDESIDIGGVDVEDL